MNTRLAIQPTIYIDSSSEASLSGADVARDYWIEKCEAITMGLHQDLAASTAARGLAEDLMTVATTESAEVLAASLFGAFRMLLDVSADAIVQNAAA